ncbi:uncharacterized protein BCR38DRAFT_485587 [Pseudomassariella vexata]|uniref:HIT-type domain-containing protein n=1 Tax=Pseudomassariella vexata TaxID=1141098 RepID=A0A1Y2DZA2_9PEZI|nr:uncharacterized protein BCR38DRAFT_485587 [Pseudomassariella vexata]ORY64436.1 hypothetical protein BCR38DRAFT_485587 [Pseudomassariella vexata]
MSPTDKTCVACKAVEGRYKCPTCSQYTCSVPCNKAHREGHADDPQPQLIPSDTVPDEGGEVSDEDKWFHNNINKLFAKFPTLQYQLASIHEATEPPSADHSRPHGMNYSSKPNQKKQQPWTADIGLENGIKALRHARDSAEDDGLDEYCDLVKIHNTRKADAAERLRRKMGETDAEIIARLIREEEEHDQVRS